VYEWRTAVLILAIVTLVRFLIRTEREQYLLPSLVSIRRDLGLGRIDIESSKEQIDVALAGLTIDQMFQKDLSEILAYYSSISAEIDQVCKEYALIEEKMSQEQDIGESERRVCEALRRSSRSRLENINKTLGLVRNHAKKMNRKMWRVRLIAPSSVEEVKAVANKVLNGVSSVEGKLDILTQRLVKDGGRPSET